MELGPAVPDLADVVGNHVAGRFDAPAYVRRAQKMHAAIATLQKRCALQREEWLEIPRLRIGQLAALAGAWTALKNFVVDETDTAVLAKLHDDLQPRLRVALNPTDRASDLRAALDEAVLALERFNQRWQAFIERLNLVPVNEAIAGYNRYYVLEKEFVVRSARLARHGFTPELPIDAARLLEQFPLLPIPRRRV
jgi:hypothetical protein